MGICEKCCDCKHIFANYEFDYLLDCDIADELSENKKCCYITYNNFEYETDEKIRKMYHELYQKERRIIK